MTDSPLHAHHEALGAVFSDFAGVSLPRHYGDGAAEYRAVREAVGVADRSDLGVVRLRGRDPVKMLHGLVTNDLLGAGEGEGVYAAMLTAKGRTIAELRALRVPGPDGTEVLALVPREALAGTMEHLKRFVPPMYARSEDASAALGVVGVYGPRSRALLGRAFGIEVPETKEDGYAPFELGGERVVAVRTLYTGEDGYDLVAASAALPALWDVLLAQGPDLGVRPVGQGAIETLRVEAGRPRYGHELTEEIIPTEAFESTGLMPRAVSFQKGCYTGQEVIVRILHRGHVNWLLRKVLLGDAPAPPAETTLVNEQGKKVGRITSAAWSARYGQTIALGYVRREIEPGTTVWLESVEGARAEIATSDQEPVLQIVPDFHGNAPDPAPD